MDLLANLTKLLINIAGLNFDDGLRKALDICPEP
jgi:hypothetical protein